MKLTIGRKITAGFFLLIMLFVISAVINIFSLNSGREIVNSNSNVVIPSVRALDEFRLTVIRSKMLATNWVYLPSNESDKKQLQELHSQEYPILNERLKALSKQWEDPSQQLLMDSLFNEFEVLIAAEKQVMASLVKFDDYEDPMTKLMAEDQVESQILPKTNTLIERLAKLSGQKEQEAISSQQKLISSFDFLVMVIIIASLIVVVIGLLAGILLSGNITKPIKYLKSIITELSKGELPKEDGNYKFPDDEVGEMGKSVYTLVDGLKSTSSFAENIGNGVYDSDFHPLGENDVLGNALIQMRNNLQSVAEEDSKRNWSVTGQAKFGDLLRDNQEEVKVLGDKVISELVNYMEANQGSLYLVNDDDDKNEYLELISCYAWGRKKFTEQKIDKGQGLAGQAWQECNAIYITDVPSDYVKITSGLGEATPSCILIQPLAVNDEIYGIIEIASFNNWEGYQLEFLAKIAESIGSTISGVRITQKTKYLLEQSQQQTEEMRAQEEEMRQNQEELQATQEEMERQKGELEEEIAVLKKTKG
jgi:HAMP domain-containing protein/putative methionine-R-sulfoxide reductase with GAF domain